MPLNDSYPHIFSLHRFFSTAIRRYEGWGYRLGDFAEHTLPLVDSVDLTIRRVGSNYEEYITVSMVFTKKYLHSDLVTEVPYRSKYNGEKNILQRLLYEHAFCRPVEGITNGGDLSQKGSREPKRRKAQVKGTLPTSLTPRLVSLEGSAGSTQFYTLEKTTGVLVMGDFGGNRDKEDDKKDDVNCRLMRGLRKMNETGIDKLIIDLVSVAYTNVTGEISH